MNLNSQRKGFASNFLNICFLYSALIAWVLAACFPATASALSPDNEKPILIEADSVEIDDGKGVSIYKGNVELEQGSIRMNADEVTVFQKDGKSDRIVAVGKPVNYWQKLEGKQGEVHAQALRMEYDADSEELILIDKAVIVQGKDRFSSDRITYDRRKAVIKGGASASGKKRVRITIDPASK